MPDTVCTPYLRCGPAWVCYLTCSNDFVAGINGPSKPKVPQLGLRHTYTTQQSARMCCKAHTSSAEGQACGPILGLRAVAKPQNNHMHSYLIHDSGCYVSCTNSPMVFARQKGHLLKGDTCSCRSNGNHNAMSIVIFNDPALLTCPLSVRKMLRLRMSPCTTERLCMYAAAVATSCRISRRCRQLRGDMS